MGLKTSKKNVFFFRFLIEIIFRSPFFQFMALDPEQREKIIQALNDDANKFLSELDPNDPLALRLREEIRLTNEHLYKLLQLSQRSAEPDVATKFDEKLTLILPNLEEFWRVLNQRVAAPIPLSMDAWEKLIVDHKVKNLFNFRVESFISVDFFFFFDRVSKMRCNRWKATSL